MPTVLITGANRGIGLYLARLYSERGDTVVAAVRDVAAMSKLDHVVAVQYDAADEASAGRVVDALAGKGITSLDVVIANAGVLLSPTTFDAVPASELTKTFAINVVAPVLLYQATLPLLLAGKPGTFTAMSSAFGSTTLAEYPMLGSYTMSKAALDHFAHLEQQELTIIAVSPGWVATEMGSAGATWYGRDKTLHEIDETIPKLFDVINGATREAHGGKLVDFTGDILPY